MVRYVKMILFTALVGLWLPTMATAETFCCPLQCRQETLELQHPYQRGTDVAILQRELKQLGYYHGPVDSIFGPQTAAAVADFQHDSGLAATGKVTNDVWTKLAEDWEKPVSNESTPPPEGEIAVVVDTINRTLTIFADNEPYKTYHVAVGAPETPSPIGEWRVSRKAMNWGTGFGTRWLGLNVTWGMYGIHGTNKPGSIGSYASHGCIRMHNYSVEELYPWVPVNAPVYVVGNPFGVPGHTHRVIVKGEKGADVAVVQDYLKRHGYYHSEVDGIFGPGMEEAVFKYRADHQLLRDNRIDREMYEMMKL